MDCRELGEGTTLFLPIAVEGGLLSCGDGHAAQGDGEIAGRRTDRYLPLQYNQLLPQRGILRFKSALGQERGTPAQEEKYQRGHRGRR
jgi:Acetamidase/Formamidase family